MQVMGCSTRLGLHAAPCLPFSRPQAPARRRQEPLPAYPGPVQQRQHKAVGLKPVSPCRRTPLCRVATPEAPQEAEEEEEDMELSYVDELNVRFGIPGMIVFSEGVNGLPRVWLRHLYSAMGVEIYLHGATITQWLRPDGSPALDQHPGLKLDPDASNKGAGLRLAFPVYRSTTTMTLDDGFAGRMPWEVVAAGLGFMPTPDGLSGDEVSDDVQLRDEIAMKDTLQIEPEDALDGGMAHYHISVESDPDEEEAEAEGEGEGEQAAGEGEGEGEQAAVAEAAGIDEEAEAVAEAPKKRGRKKKSASPEQPAADAAEASSSAGSVAAGQGADGEAVAAAGVDDAEQDPEEADGEDEGEDEEEVEISPGLAYMIEQLDKGYDPAPFVTLRLTDNEQTRAIWPHKFELLYKISIMEVDDAPSTEVLSGAHSISASDSLYAIAHEDQETMRMKLESAPQPVLDVPGRTDEFGMHVPVQLLLHVVLNNLDPEESEDMMEFEIGALMQFAVEDVLKNGDFVKVLGLGHLSAIDYNQDPRFGALMANDEDYLHFRGTPLDATFPRALRSDVKLTPGDGTHYEITSRAGFSDVTIHHPGLNPRLFADPHKCLAGLGVGRVAVPKTLEAGDSWEGQFVVRWHNKYWETPIFGEENPPLPEFDNKEFESEDAANPFGAVEDDDAYGAGAETADA